MYWSTYVDQCVFTVLIYTHEYELSEAYIKIKEVCTHYTSHTMATMSNTETRSSAAAHMY